MTGPYVDHGWRHGPGGTDPAPSTPGAGFIIKVFGDLSDVTTGDGKHKYAIPADLDGVKLTAAHAFVTAVSTSGTTTVQIQNKTQAVDMLSTRITIDANEKTSYDPDFPPTVPPVVNAANATVAQGDEIWIDVDTVGTPAPKGLGVIFVWGAPPGGANIGPPGPPGADSTVPGPPGADATGFMVSDTFWDAKGDLAAGTGSNTAVRVPVGTNGQVLVADSTQAAGVKWDTPTAGATDGWTAAGETWTYASATTFTVSGDVTAKYTAGTRVKLTQTTPKYFVVVSSAHSAGTTTVTVTGGTDFTLASAAISSPSYSYAANPQGFPGWFAYTPTVVGWGTPTIALAQFNIVGLLLTVNVNISGTSNSATTSFTLPVTLASVTYNPFAVGNVSNNGTRSFGRFAASSSATTVACGPSPTSDTWTASGSKEIYYYQSMRFA